MYVEWPGREVAIGVYQRNSSRDMQRPAGKTANPLDDAPLLAASLDQTISSRTERLHRRAAVVHFGAVVLVGNRA